MPAKTGDLINPTDNQLNEISAPCVTASNSVLDRRRAGVLLHITSLPGPGRNGTLGLEAFRFVDFLVGSGISVWQTLPINPPHADGSPYQCLSVHAGNPALIDPHWLVRRGWLPEQEAGPSERAADAEVRVDQAFKMFRSLGDAAPERSRFDRFIDDHRWWLDDYALYMAIREECGHDPWHDWPVALRDRWPTALTAATRRLARVIDRYRFQQYVFFEQWGELRAYARRKNIVLFGDMPIFVAADSADVWARRDYFDLTVDGNPRVVAGVPPDYFSETGQRWGNPHYDWSVMEADGFRWWLDRLRTSLELYDWIRIDHFRGFEAYWEIPAESETAKEGRWIKAPGGRLLETFARAYGRSGLPLVAEDLGIITSEVEALRDQYGLPGMKILQFAFDGGPSNPYLPHNHPVNSVVYTGTHDNDTTVSWFEDLPPEQQQHIYDYLGYPEIPMPWALIRCALASDARLAMLPMQDLLGLGKGHRMNTPGTLVDNWCWRFGWHQLTEKIVDRLDHWVKLYGRHPAKPAPTDTTPRAAGAS